jgi:hypothetical protein
LEQTGEKVREKIHGSTASIGPSMIPLSPDDLSCLPDVQKVDERVRKE